MALLSSTRAPRAEQPLVLRADDGTPAPQLPAVTPRPPFGDQPAFGQGAPRQAAPAPIGAPFPLKVEAPTDPAPPASVAKRPATKQVDESALRYYASLNDVARVSVEIRRLQALYPTWEPPADLMSGTNSSQNEQPLWDLFAAGKYDEVQTEIANLQATQPDWQPSSDLTTKLNMAMLMKQLVTASDAKQWGDVIALAAQNNNLLVCSDVDAIWRVAEALAQVGDKDRAYSAYSYVLSNCSDPHERLATVQKAVTLLAPTAVETLIGMGRRKPDGTSEFESVKLDLLRSKIGASITDLTLDAPSAAELDKLAHAASMSSASKDFQLLGWYSYSRKDYPGALTWFTKAVARDHDPKSIEGLALSEKMSGKLQDAEDTAFASATVTPEIAAIFVDVVASQITATPPATLTPDRQSRFVKVVEDTKSALGAQSLGWYIYNRGDIRGSEIWFKKSVDWKASEEATIGLAIAAKRVGDLATFRATIKSYEASFPRLADLEQLGQPATLRAFVGGQSRRVVYVYVATKGKHGRTTMVRTPRYDGSKAQVDEALALFHSDKYNEAIAALDRMKHGDKEDPGMHILRGWALYHNGNLDEAKKVFAEAAAQRPKESQQGTQVINWMQQPPFLRQ